MKNFIKENWFHLIIILLSFIIVLLVTNYYYFILPNRQLSNDPTISTKSIPTEQQINLTQPTSTTITQSHQDDPQVKIEKCKILADIQAKQALKLYIQNPPMASTLNLQNLANFAASTRIFCQSNQSCINEALDNHLKDVETEKEMYLQQHNQQYYLTCLNQ